MSGYKTRVSFTLTFTEKNLKVAYHITFIINEIHLLWPNFIAIGIYFLFGTKFSWNEETDTCFNVECM